MASKPQEEQIPTPDYADEDQSQEGSVCHSDSKSVNGATQAPVIKKKKKKKALPLKVFSDEDVIRLLNRLAVFWADGRNNKWVEFHQFVKNDLSKEFTKTQVSEKIRSLRKKFVSVSERAQLNGGRIDLSDPHELAVFELSKPLWGDEIISEKSEGSKKRKQVGIKGDEPNTMISEEEEEEEEANKILSKGKAVDEDGEKKKKKKKKREDSDENDKEKMEIGLEEFKSKYPLLCESFKWHGIPKVRIEEVALIGRENAEALEKQWREINAELLHRDLKKIDILNLEPSASD